ncbi:MAG: Sjogren's syndrome/scleroderma autoantigen 1 family protein [Methanomicrobiaceae archaeon]|nr:Sjogren's syndrome/scleroderma autoantigen 1 family protein [Methanomicrobiaceae archaeon]
MKKPDEIMADYLLKGGKMLSKACNACGSPLFEYKGETLCVVCAEQGGEITEAPAARAPNEAPPAPELPTPAGSGVSALAEELDRTLVYLCERIRSEARAEDCLMLMECVAQGIEVRRHL